MGDNDLNDHVTDHYRCVYMGDIGLHGPCRMVHVTAHVRPKRHRLPLKMCMWHLNSCHPLEQWLLLRPERETLDSLPIHLLTSGLEGLKSCVTVIWTHGSLQR